MIKKILIERIIKDPEYWFIIFFNLLIVYLYLQNDYDINLVIWGYYLQSIFIGLQYVLITTVQKYKENRSNFPIKKHVLTIFFTVHYGIFHLVYFIFLIPMTSRIGGDNYDIISLITYIKGTLLALGVNALFLAGREFMPNTPDYNKPSVIAAYARIIPIHILIVLAGFQKERILGAFLVFMVLKMVIDLIVYSVSQLLNVAKSTNS
ncbi:MAG: DUF6498-containing protein [Bacteroidia bacterium]